MFHVNNNVNNIVCMTASGITAITAYVQFMTNCCAVCVYLHLSSKMRICRRQGSTVRKGEIPCAVQTFQSGYISIIALLFRAKINKQIFEHILFFIQHSY